MVSSLIIIFSLLQTHEWLSCRDRLSVSNLERICEEGGKEEKNMVPFECTQIDRKSPDSNMATRYRRQIKRPMSVSGYPTLEQSRRSAEFGHDFKSSEKLEKASETKNIKPAQPEKLSTMRRASFQCHVVLTKPKDKMPQLSASHEYPSPMHAVMRQYQSKIDDDKEKNDPNQLACSNRTFNNQAGSREGATVTRRSSFTARSCSRTDDQNSPPIIVASPRRTFSQETLSYRRSIDTPSTCSPVDDELSKRQTNEMHEVTDTISRRETLPGKNRDIGVSRRDPFDQKTSTELKTTDSSQIFGRTQIETGVRTSSNPYHQQQQHQQNQVHITKEKLPRQNSNSSEKYSEYQNLKDLEQGKIWKIDTVPSINAKPADNQYGSRTQLSVTERGKNLQNLKGDSSSYISDEGYCASLSSILSGRRQLSIQSDTSWISADIDDSKSCDSNVVTCESSCSSHIAQSTHVQKVDRKPSLSRCKNSMIMQRKEGLQAPKVLPFRQTSLWYDAFKNSLLTFLHIYMYIYIYNYIYILKSVNDNIRLPGSFFCNSAQYP